MLVTFWSHSQPFRKRGRYGVNMTGDPPKRTQKRLKVLRALRFQRVLSSNMDEIIESTERREGNWGLNVEDTCCPACGRPQPKVRVPRSVQEILWGGWSCPCGARLDKWGRFRQ